MRISDQRYHVGRWIRITSCYHMIITCQRKDVAKSNGGRHRDPMNIIRRGKGATQVLAT